MNIHIIVGYLLIKINYTYKKKFSVINLSVPTDRFENEYLKPLLKYFTKEDLVKHLNLEKLMIFQNLY
jgi:hypothetical protein